MSDSSIAGLLGQVARQLLERLGGGATAPAGGSAPVPSPPSAGTPGLDRLLPPVVNGCPRVHVNDRFGGLDQGGVHATYDAGGREVRVLVRRAGSTASALAMVAGAPPGPGRSAWNDGRVWFAASGGTVLGDEDPSFGPGDVEAFDRFLAEFRRTAG